MFYNPAATVMNIAFISYWSCPLQRTGVLASGGMNIYVLNLADSLGKLGIKVDIYTPSHNDRDEKILTPHENVRIIHINLQKSKTVVEFAALIIKFMENNNLKYDLLHAHYYYSGLAGIILKKQLNIALFTTFHSLGRTKEIYAGITNRFRINSEKKVVEKSDAVIASTELEKKDLIENYRGVSGKIYVVVPGVNHKIFKPRNKTFARLKLGIPPTLKTMLFVGRIDPIKGVNLLIEAIAYLVKNHKSFENKYRLIIIGGDIKSRGFWQNSEVVKIKQSIAEKNLECCIKFIGSKPHSHLPLYYSSSDIVVMPSHYESFGLVVLEAMACGSCVVASKTGGMKYLIEDNISGRFFETGNIESLANILWKLLDNSRLRIKLGKQALIASGDYCWDKQAAKISGIYKKYCI